MAITPSQWAAEGAIPGMNRQQEFASKMATEELMRTEKTADIYGKVIDNEEARYDLNEKKSERQRTKRDVEAGAATKKAENAGYRYASDTDQRKLIEAANAAQIAQQTGDPRAKEESIKLMSAAHPVYAKMLKEETDPKRQQMIIDSIGAGISRSLEVAQKGVMLGMEGDQARQTLADRQAGDQSLQEEKFNAMVEMAEDERRFKYEQSYLSKEHEREMAGWKHAGTASIRSYAEETGDWEGAGAMYEALHKSQIEKLQRAGRTGSTVTQENKSKIAMSTDVLNKVMRRAASTASGGDLKTIDDPADMNKIPGGAEMGAYVDKLVNNDMGAQATQMTNERFAYVDEDRGFVKLPTDPESGAILGGKTATQLATIARNLGVTLEDVLREHRTKMIAEKVITEDEWRF